MEPINFIPVGEATELPDDAGRKQWALAQKLAHDDHPLRHWDHTCAACQSEVDADAWHECVEA